MSKYCGKCGGQLDNKTGLCPNCDADKLAEKKRSRAVGEINNQANTPDYRKPVKLTRKQKKAIKKANRTTSQKIKIIFIKIFLLIILLFLLALLGIGLLSYNNIIKVPIITPAINNISGNNDIQFDNQALYETEYSPNESDITYERDDHSRGFVNNIINIFFKREATVNQINNVVAKLQGERVGIVDDGIRLYQIRIAKSTREELNNICSEVDKMDGVISAEIDEIYCIEQNYIPGDPWSEGLDGLWSVNWDETNPSGTNWWVESTKLLSAWDNNDKLERISVGIVDNGFDTDHEDLNITVINENDNSKEEHGTHVAGVVGATTDNGKGITGILSNVNLYGVDCYATNQQKKKSISILNQFLGFNECISKGCKVINYSSGVEYKSEKQAKEDSIDSTNSTLDYLIILLNYYYDKDFIIVNSAGNGDNNWMGSSGVDAKKYNGFFCGIDRELVTSKLEKLKNDKRYDHLPSIDEILGSFMVVAAVSDSKNNGKYQLAKFSNYGDAITVCAPGVNVFSTIASNWFDGSYKYMDGTSMAAPIVSGITALTWAANPNLKSKEVKQIIIETATEEVLARQSKDKGKYYLVNADKAIKKVIGEKSNNKNGNNNRQLIDQNTERDVVLVLDSSGSMDGKPLEETKKAAIKFVNTVLGQGANIGIVKYDGKAEIVSPFSTDENALIGAINNIDSGGATNIEDGLSTAESMLSSSSANKKIIVLMSDGEPNNGKVGDELIAYANELKNKDTYIYTLGFFESISDKTNAQYLMEKIASDGCHYEVSDADSLVYFFGDIADQINGQKYIYVRIACPVDISVSYNGETLNSAENALSTRTSFGSLTFEDADTQAIESYNSNTSTNQSDESDDKVKILRLKEGEDYDIKIEGTGKGRMNYSIGFMDENGEYSDFRKFNNVKITRKTQIDTVAKVSDKTVMNVDEDGDGKYDLTYEARANSRGEIVDNSFIVNLILILLGVLVLLIIILIIYKKVQKTKIKKSRRDYNG